MKGIGILRGIPRNPNHQPKKKLLWVYADWLYVRAGLDVFVFSPNVTLTEKHNKSH